MLGVSEDDAACTPADTPAAVAAATAGTAPRAAATAIVALAMNLRMIPPAWAGATRLRYQAGRASCTHLDGCLAFQVTGASLGPAAARATRRCGGRRRGPWSLCVSAPTPPRERRADRRYPAPAGTRSSPVDRLDAAGKLDEPVALYRHLPASSLLGLGALLVAPPRTARRARS